jgi:putative transposase
MFTLFFSLLGSLRSCFQTRAALQLEILAIRHQINVLLRAQRGRVRLTRVDRLLWTLLLHLWSGWRSALIIVKPETVIAWHRRGFRLFWAWKSRKDKPGRPEVPRGVRDLIRKMSLANPLWGAPRIHVELLKLGIELSQATVAKYMDRHRKPPSQTWRTFLDSHLKQLVSTDFFVVPTANLRILFVFVVLAHPRRRVIHFNVTAHPTSEWTAQQIAEAFPWDTAPHHLLHDRDSVYGDITRQRVRGMDIREVLTAPRSPWQSPYVERLIGSVRRECLDHLIVFNESSLRHALKSYFDYYHGARTHLSLD